MLWLLALAAGGYYWYTQEQKKKAAAAVNPGTSTGYIAPGGSGILPGDTPHGAAGVFINVDGAESNVNTAINEFNTLIAEGLINANANSLGLSPYEKDVIYRDLKPDIFLSSAHQEQEANRIWAKYPGLKIS